MINFILSCAAIQSPSGGEKDTTPPYIVSSFPENGRTNFNGQKIILTFSEYLNFNSVEKSIKITPIIKPEPTLVFKGQTVEICLNSSLVKNQTYIISINKNLEDEHNVPLRESEQVAFSTGFYIDDGSISGKVYNAQEGSVSLYKLTNKNNIDNIYSFVPDYTYDISASGMYEFNYLSEGNYILSLVNKEFAGRIIHLEKTEYSLSWHPKINIRKGTNIKNMNIYMGVKNKRIKVEKINWVNGNWGKIKFSNNINAIPPLKFYNELNKQLKNEIFIDPIEQNIVHFFIHDTLDPFVLIHSDGFYNNNGYYIDSLKARIKVNTFKDTSNINIISPTENYILPIENESQIKLQVVFSSLVNSLDKNNISILNEDSVLIPIKISWESPLSMNIIPQISWKEKTKYKLKFKQKSIITKYSKGLVDSIKVINFQTSLFQKYGSLSFATINSKKGKFIAQLQPFENNLKTHNINIDLDNLSRINKIVEGKYSLMIYNDVDKNDRYSNGSLKPYVPSEWFYYYPDTIKIRSNWEVDLGEIDLRIN